MRAKKPRLARGQRVAVIGTRDGRFVVEGWGVVTRPLPSWRAWVRFDGEPDRTFNRWIEEAAQADPDGYCAALNRRDGRD